MNQEFDLAGRPENGGNLGRAIPQTHLLVSKIRRDIPPDTQGLHITTRSTWRPFGSERLDMSSSTCLTAEGLSTGYRTRQQDGGQATPEAGKLRELGVGLRPLRAVGSTSRKP